MLGTIKLFCIRMNIFSHRNNIVLFLACNMTAMQNLYWSILCRKKVIAQFQKRERMIGHHTSLRENDDLPLWRAPAIKKKSLFFNVRKLIMRAIMRSKDAQCSTWE